MPDKHLFEYAVVRVVPRVEREEFMNVGVILYCAAHRYLGTQAHLNSTRLLSLHPGLDLAAIQCRVDAFQAIAYGGPAGGPIGQLPIAARFRWLTAARSTLLQTSAIHPGLCADPAATLQKLFDQLVL